jgi:hypothetical protein
MCIIVFSTWKFNGFLENPWEGLFTKNPTEKKLGLRVF